MDKEAFAQIKEAIIHTLTLISPNYNKYFILYIFASNTCFAVVLTQKSNEQEEFLFSFMSSRMQST